LTDDDRDCNVWESVILWVYRIIIIAWIMTLIICWTFNFVKFTETELSSIILNKSSCKFSIDELNSHIIAHKLALLNAQSDENCRLDIWDFNLMHCWQLTKSLSVCRV